MVFRRRRGTGRGRRRTRYLWWRNKANFSVSGDPVPAQPVPLVYAFSIPLFTPAAEFGAGSDIDSVDREWVAKAVRMHIGGMRMSTTASNTLVFWELIAGLYVGHANESPFRLPDMVSAPDASTDWMWFAHMGVALFADVGAQQFTFEPSLFSAGNKDYGVHQVRVARRLGTNDTLRIVMQFQKQPTAGQAFGTEGEAELASFQFHVHYSVLFRTRGPGAI